MSDDDTEGGTRPSAAEREAPMTSGSPNPRTYFSFSDRTDVAIALEECGDALLKILRTEESRPWKRAFSSMQRALQSALTVAAGDSAGLGALQKQSQKRVWDHIRGKGSAPEYVRVQSFGTLLKTVEAKEAVTMPEDLRWAVEKVNEIRTKADHPKPNQTDTILVDGGPQLIRLCSAAIAWLMENGRERQETLEILPQLERLYRLTKALVFWAPDIFGEHVLVRRDEAR
ncbi:MAG: hypothetical protein NXI18_21305 [Alphaproteobacteria bacterium]|nr:hypothetical protein [Alphaproteobacteria bacterium]